MLSAPVLIGAATITLIVLTIATRRLDYERIPQAAVLAAAFFVCSLFSVPIGPSSVHLVLNGLMGLVLGWSAVPAILIALLMQAIFFGYGGLLVLGSNTLNIALPALLISAILAPRLQQAQVNNGFLIGAIAGAGGVLLTGILVSLSLAFSGPDFIPAASVMLATYLPLMVVEAAVTGFAINFILRVSPELVLPLEKPVE